MHRLWQQRSLICRACTGFLLAVALLAAQFVAAYAERVGIAQRKGLRIPVPRQTIYPGQRIHPAMLAWRRWRGRGDLSGVATVNRDLLGKVARSTLLPNRIIYIATLREPFAVNKGQMVSLFLKYGGIEIYSKGIAQQSGAVGTFVEVQNVDSGRTISGTVQGDGSIRVGGHR